MQAQRATQHSRSPQNSPLELAASKSRSPTSGKRNSICPTFELLLLRCREQGTSIDIIPLPDGVDGQQHVESFGHGVLAEGSPLCDIARYCSVIFFHGGLIRLLGAGQHRLCKRSLASYSVGRFRRSSHGRSAVTHEVEGDGPAASTSELSSLIVGDDVFGGTFAIAGRDAIEGVAAGNVAYLCPEGAQWDDLGIKFPQFLQWCCSKQYAQFYGSLLWLGWEGDVASLDANQALRFQPALYEPLEEGAIRRRVVAPIENVFDELRLVHRKMFHPDSPDASPPMSPNRSLNNSSTTIQPSSTDASKDNNEKESAPKGKAPAASSVEPAATKEKTGKQATGSSSVAPGTQKKSSVTIPPSKGPTRNRQLSLNPIPVAGQGGGPAQGANPGQVQAAGPSTGSNRKGSKVAASLPSPRKAK